MYHLSQITAGEGECRHLSNTANSGKMADLVRRYNSLIPSSLEHLRLVIVKVLIKTMNEVILRKFLDNRGLEILNLWLEHSLLDIQHNLQTQMGITQEMSAEEFARLESNLQASQLVPDISEAKRDFIIGLLSALRKLPISVQSLKEVKIGKKI
jgi:hypothetical protein